MNVFNYITNKLIDEKRDAIGLFLLCKKFGGYYHNGIYNALMRNGIDSIKKLYETDIYDIAEFRNIGKRRTNVIDEMKQYIDEGLKEFDRFIDKFCEIPN